MKPEIQKQAIRLRKRGYAYPEISRRLGVSKSTCSIWLKDLVLSKKASEIINNRKTASQKKGRAVIERNRRIRDMNIQKEALCSFNKVHFDVASKKLLCAVLYWAEGHKRTSQVGFTNSDPGMIRTYLTMLRSAFKIKEDKLHAWLQLHEYHNVDKQKQYWANITDINVARINIYIKPNTGKNKRAGYPGCICVRYGDVKLAKEIEFLYNSLIDKYGRVG